MKRTEAVSIGDIIRNVIKTEHLEDRLLEQRIIDTWPTVVGGVINRYTVNRYIINHVLHVQLTSSTLKNELMLHKTQLLDALNKAAGRPTITDIIIK